MLNRQYMCAGEIGHMHIIANRGSIRRLIIGPENLNPGHPAQCGINNQRDELGLGLVVFADLGRRCTLAALIYGLAACSSSTSFSMGRQH